jgi:hypothetical protein
VASVPLLTTFGTTMVIGPGRRHADGGAAHDQVAGREVQPLVAQADELAATAEVVQDAGAGRGP